MYRLVAEAEAEATKKFPVAMRLWVTPVPILNTTVKTQAADGTMLETVWKSRWLPGFLPFGGVAQVGERLPCKQEVRGSSPLISTFSDDPDSGIVPGRDGLKRPAAKRKPSRTAP